MWPPAACCLSDGGQCVSIHTLPSIHHHLQHTLKPPYTPPLRAHTHTSDCAAQCDPAAAADHGGCSVFSDRRPRSVAVTVLVVVEMFNALNNLSEDASLLTLPPWSNPALLVAILGSLVLHWAVLSLKPLAGLFGVAPLGAHELAAVVALSAPVVLLDEVLKALSRGGAAGVLAQVVRRWAAMRQNSGLGFVVGGFGAGGGGGGGGAAAGGLLQRRRGGGCSSSGFGRSGSGSGGGGGFAGAEGTPLLSIHVASPALIGSSGTGGGRAAADVAAAAADKLH